MAAKLVLERMIPGLSVFKFVHVGGGMLNVPKPASRNSQLVTMSITEKARLDDDRAGIPWKNWGPYLSERQWATVREDYSEHGNAWEALVHDQARSKAYRWGEDGIGGFSNEDQRICFAWAFWNGRDPILKERLFGLTGNEGNHGEDVKELYYYLDSTPTHSYMKMLYKYPAQEFPYAQLVEENSQRSRTEREYELLDTGLFDEDDYFDLFMEYAKKDPYDFLFKCTAHYRGDEAQDLYILPTLWFRNTWSSGRDVSKPKVSWVKDNTLLVQHHVLGDFHLYFDGTISELLFCDNETNRKRLYGIANASKYPKDAINDYVIHGAPDTNPKLTGTKASGVALHRLSPKRSAEVRVRMTKEILEHTFAQYDQI
ncbi:MAG: hypothetical protein AAGA85_15170, partial [Bacteroidota bacterium]